MLNFYRNYWRTAFDIGLIILTIFLIMWAFSFIYNIAKPIFYSFIIFLCIEPLARRLNKWGIKKSIASAISALLFTLIVLGIIGGIITLAVIQGNELITLFPEYQSIFNFEIGNLTAQIQHLIDRTPLNVNVGDELAKLLQDASIVIQSWAKLGLTWFIAQVSSITSFIINAAIGLILAYFLSIEIIDWKKLATKHTPNTFKTAFFFLRDNVLKGIWIYIKAQAILISITFIVILVALLIMGVNHAVIIAVVAGIFDVLPLLGVSTIFVPWIAYLFIVGDYQLAIMLTVLWLVVVLTRQIMEPKITGDSLGVSAFTMLSFMIISLSIFGVAGLIVSPILLILIKALMEQGYLAKWIRKPIDEYDEPTTVKEMSIAQPQTKVNFIDKLINILQQLKKDNQLSHELNKIEQSEHLKKSKD